MKNKIIIREVKSRAKYFKCLNENNLNAHYKRKLCEVLRIPRNSKNITERKESLLCLERFLW